MLIFRCIGSSCVIAFVNVVRFQAQQTEKLLNLENDISELTEEAELMKSINKLSDQTNKKLQKRIEEYQCQVATAEVIHFLLSSYQWSCC